MATINECEYDNQLTTKLVNQINGMEACVDPDDAVIDASDRALCAYTSRRKLLTDIKFDALHRCKMNPARTFPARDVIKAKLVRLSGVAEGKLLFDSKELAAVGRKVAGGKERAGSTPAYFGHAANLYLEGTIGKGINDSLWVVVAETSETSTPTNKNKTYHRWVEATELEKAKYETLMELEKAIKERRAYVCSLTKNLNKQVAHYGGMYADNAEVLGKHLERAAKHAARSPRRNYGNRDGGGFDFDYMMNDDF